MFPGILQKDYEKKKELVGGEIISRLEKKLFPGLKASIVFKEVGTPKTHRRYLARDSGTYGPMPQGTPKWLLRMPFNTTEQMVEPAIIGTKNVIVAAAEIKVRRVVFTSSIGAVYMDP